MNIKKMMAMSSMFLAFNALAFDESESIVLKLRGNYSFMQAKQKNLPAPTSARATAPNSPASVGKLFNGALGVEGSATLFLNDCFAGEFGVGWSLFRGKKTTTQAINYNYNDNDVDNKKRDINAIPAYFTMQYHIAPYGAVRPYVGAGYHYTYINQKAKEYKMNSAHGFVGQVGVDVVLKDDTYLNLDVKQYMLKTTVRYSRGFTGTADQISSKVRLNPLVVGLGLGFKL